MATNGTYRSHHVVYPIQAPFDRSRRSSITTNGTRGSQSRTRYSIISQQGRADTGCPYKHTWEGHSHNDPAFVTPTPQQLPSPLLSESDHRSWHDSMDQNLTPSHTQPGSWSRMSYPVQPTNGVSTNRDSVISSSKVEEMHERPASQLSNTSSKGTIGRTLRRSQRGRRIESPVQMHSKDESVSYNMRGDDYAQFNNYHVDEHRLNTNTDAVPKTSSESPTIHSKVTTSNIDVNQNSPIQQLDVSQQDLIPKAATDDTSDRLKSESFKDIEPMSYANASVQRNEETKPVEKVHEIWHRRAYPLQTPASNTTLRSLPTPPPSPPNESLPEHTPEDSADKNETKLATTNTEPLRRQAYPLQSPASANHLQNDQSLQSPEKEDTAKPEDQPVTESFKSVTGSALHKSLRRQAYPLQAPASAVNLRDGHTGSTSGEAENTEVDEKHATAPQINGSNTVVHKSLRRQAYPLQSPASIVNLQNQQSSTLDGSEIPPSNRQNVVGEEQQKSKRADNKALRRQIYPLQSPASILDLQNGQDSTVQEDASDKREVLQAKPQPESRPRRESKSLRRQAYPLQAPASIADLQQLQSPPDSAQTDNLAEDAPTPREVTKPVQAQQSKSLRRQAYPLQAPASAADLKQNQKEVSANSEQGSTQPLKQEETASNDNFPVQRAYPLQAPVTTSEQIHEETPAQTEDRDSHTGPGLPKIQTQEVFSPTMLSPSWRRKTYPLHTHEDVVPSRSVTPQPPWEDPRDPESILLPKHIPAVHDSSHNNIQGRTIVVCLDGTGDKFDSDNSNIVHLISALKKDDARQVTYYQAGIGTYSAGGLSSGFAAAMDMAVGSGLGLHVRDAYHFLMHSYQEGDRICIFGFSRGAYTARCLAGMIHKVGLLPPRNIQQIPFAYEFYSNDSPEGWVQSDDFKKTFSIDVNVYFLGCFDSVASVGFIPRQLPLSSTPKNKPLYFRHAMALDERRAKFKICRHQTKRWEEIERKSTTKTSAILEAEKAILPNFKDQNDTPEKLYSPSSYGARNHPNLTDAEYKRLMGPAEEFDTNVLEVWFAGAHADVGGGAVPNIERHKLAQIPLRWMIRQAFECNTGILFKTKVLAEHGLDVHTLWPKYTSLKAPTHGPPPSYLEKYEKGLPPRSIRQAKLVPTNEQDNGEQLLHLKSHTDDDWTPEQLEDYYDAISPLNDQLVQAPTWWILEMWPVQLKMPVEPGKYYVRTGLNLGRYRAVEDLEPNLHWTVRHRMQHLGYKMGVRDTKQTRWRTVV